MLLGIGRSSRSYAESGTGRRRKYLHDPVEAAPYQQEPGTFTPWEDVSANTDLLFCEELQGAMVTPEVNVARQPDLLIGVVPVINLEWIQALWRHKSTRGYSMCRWLSRAVRILHVRGCRRTRIEHAARLALQRAR